MVISKRAILTAKHVGVTVLKVGGRELKPIGNFPHPEYDACIIFFGEDLPSPAKLATRVEIGQMGVVAGWGDTGRVAPEGDRYFLTVRDRRDVRRAAPLPLGARQSLPKLGPLLLGVLVKPGQATVEPGDSGGGYFFGGKLAGITLITHNSTGGPEKGGKVNRGFASTNGGKPYHLAGALDLTDPTVSGWIRRTLKEGAGR